MINLTIYVSVLLMIAGVLSTPASLSHYAQRGGITFYYNEFEGRSLKCPGYRYERDTGPWLAVDIDQYTSGKTKCGDLYLIMFYDGSTQVARALDSGYLGNYKVWDSGLPFVADLPRYWRDGRETKTGTIVNISALLRDVRVK
jgi:hypothetical protein